MVGAQYLDQSSNDRNPPSYFVGVPLDIIRAVRLSSIVFCILTKLLKYGHLSLWLGRTTWACFREVSDPSFYYLFFHISQDFTLKSPLLKKCQHCLTFNYIMCFIYIEFKWQYCKQHYLHILIVFCCFSFKKSRKWNKLTLGIKTKASNLIQLKRGKTH